jgi:hypothetical protein
MTVSRFLLGLVAAIGALGAMYLATTDVHYRDRNCGTAIYSTDPNKLTFVTGDPSQDDFVEQSTTSNCNHLLVGRRFLAAGPAVVCVVAIVIGRRLRDGPRKPARSPFGVAAV